MKCEIFEMSEGDCIYISFKPEFYAFLDLV